MSDVVHAPHISPFDAIRHEDRRGEWWSARELMVHFGYAQWRDVRDGIARAVASIANSLGETAAQDHIALDRKMIDLGKRARREIEDFRLTRYGAYIWAMNCDPHKAEIAAAQTYFAVKTREAELAPSAAGDDLDLLQGMLDRLKEDRHRIQVVEGRQDVAEAKIAAIEGRQDWFTALGYARLKGFPTSRPYLARVGRHATALMHSRGEGPERRQDATFGAINVYPANVLAESFAAVTT